MKQEHIWHLFLSTAAAYPNETAVFANDRQLSYSELQQEVFHYVAFLRKQGVQAQDCIGILLPRNSQLIVAMLAILACGASYVPLDQRNPRERNLTILKDSNSRFIITDKDYPDCQNLAAPQGEKLASMPITIDLNPSQVAYIIYTSGSTGQPKGVMLTHANLSAFINWARSQYQLDELRYTLALTAINFDLSIFEIFVPLCFGGCVVLIEHALALIDQKNLPPITLINTVPSAIEALLRAKAIPSSVVTINLAGEALQQSLVNELYEKTQAKRIYNLYGPTETTTYSTSYLAENNNEHVMVPIGKAIQGTQIFLLDQHQQPVPKLVRGEVYIAGKGLSLGYCNREEETKSRFIDLQIKGQTIKAYRSGDLARVNHQGNLEYLGRKDQQVKIRGFRIELDEIIHLIKQYNVIEQAFVTTHPQVENEQSLIAYIVSSNHETNTASLHSWLAERLPEYMLPSYYVQLNSLPLNANGKIDRAQLPLPFQQETYESEYQNETEVELGVLWQAVLPQSQFNRNDNFFYVGGHSLTAAKLQSKIRGKFTIEFKLEEIFSAPSIRQQAEIIRKRQAEQAPHHQFSILARPKEIPLSFSQQRLWYLQYAEEHTPISNIPIQVNLTGELDLTALIKSFERIIERHEILRTTYHSVNYHLVQVIHDKFEFSIPVIDCEQENMAQLLAAEANKKFDLTQDLMLRAVLFKTTQGQQTLMVTQHHIASDAWSLNILMQELTALYRAFHRGLDQPQLPIPTQYADYSCWQRYYLNDRALKSDLNYWQKKLENAPESIRLPYDKARPETHSYHGEFYQWDLPADITAKLKTLAQQNQATLFMVLLTGFHILLYRYTQQKDFCVGILSANRPFNELEHTLGFFVNTLVARPQLESTLSVRHLLQQTKKQTLEALAHQQLPFDKLVESLRPNRQSNRHPFFQVLFSLQNALENDLQLDDVQLEANEFDRRISKFDLTLSLVEKRDSLSAIFEFNSDLFLRDTIARMTHHYQQILISMINDFEHTIGEIDLLTKDERTQWLVNLNDVTADYPHASISRIFTEISQQFSVKTALVSASETLTYAELNGRANQLAHLLQTYGVSNEVTVGVMLPRGIDVVVSMLAVMKAGGCYVPLDPNWPDERINYIVEDAQITVVVTLDKFLDHVPSTPNLYVISLDCNEEIQQQSHENIKETITPEQSCYIMYTSGSTGKPKGVIATQQAVARLVKNTNYIKLDAQQTLLQISQLVFDAATFDIWGSLLNGATLILMPDGLPELNKLSELLQQYDVTTIFVTTHLFNTLVDYKLESLSSLKQILFGGDVASTHHVEKFKKRFPTCHISNIYGPTECTTYALSYLIPENFDTKKPLPLGTPITNTSVVILSEDLQVVPVGVPGQICLGGPGLAKGYLNQPDLTQEKFIANPITEINSKRLYLTGDVGCYRADGQIAFLGRVDDQIKLRGYRIELAEIEQALRELTGIIDAVVLVQKPEDLLVAYLLTNDEKAKPIQEIKLSLGSRLPRYMLPDAVIVLPQFPLTTNGKIDKSQLPRYTVERSKLVTAHHNSDVSDVIQKIWIDVLNDEEITLEDNFFDIGGNSLKIVHVLDRLQTHFKDQANIMQKLEITTLFQYPTINELANFLQVAQEEDEIPTHTKRRAINRDKRKNATAL